MPLKITLKDIIWNYVGNILNIGVNILILPIVLKMLSAQELGLWYVFGSLSALVVLLDFGFSPTIMRNITYAWSGAKNVLKEGTSHTITSAEPNHSLLKSLIISSKKIYLIMSVLAFAILLTVGSVYIYSLLPNKGLDQLLPWFIYAFAVFLNLYYSYWSPVLKGIGKIKETNQIMIISKAVYILLAFIGLILGEGLAWLSFCYLVSGLLIRLLSRSFFNKELGQKLKGVALSDEYGAKETFGIIWFNAKKQLIVTVGAWLITRTNTLLCSSFLGLEIASQYGLSLQLFGVIGSISSLLFSSYVPELTSLKVSSNKDRYISIFSRAIVLQWFMGIIGILAVLLLAPFALRIIGSNSDLLPVDISIVLAVILFLEWNHSTFSTLITLSNKVPFVKASILSGIGIVVFSLIILNFTKLGLLGLIITQGVVQLAYNNWYWPRMVLKENNISIGKIIYLALTDLKKLIHSHTVSSN